MSKCITKYQEIPFIKTNVAVVKRQIMMSTNEDVEKLEPSHMASGNVQGYNHFENSLFISQKGKHTAQQFQSSVYSPEK